MFVRCEQCPLRRRTVFRAFSDNELSFIIEMKTDHIVVAPRVDIIREDEVGGPVYTLFEGWAMASAVLGTVKHSVQAITTATLCVLHGKGFSDLFAGHPALALNVLQTRVEEEQRMDVRLSLLGRSTAEQRIAYLMLETFDRLRQRGMLDRGSTCPFPLQRRDLADAAGLSRVHVARTLESLRERRLAEIQNGTLVIFDRTNLTELAGYIPLGTAAGRRALL